MERQKQTGIDRSVRDECEAAGTASVRGDTGAAGHGATRIAVSTAPPRHSGHYICSCEGGSTPYDIPQELQLFTAGRHSRNLLWSETLPDGANPGARGLSADLAERPPPAWG